MTHDFSGIEYLIHLQDFVNESFCTGSGFLVRRSALESIQGFPEDSLQEDILTSIALSASGWQTVYVPQSVQWGLAAATYADWVRQRQRWAAGILSIAQYLASARAKGLPFAARVTGGLWGVVDGFAAFVWTATVVLLPLLLLSGRPLLPLPSIPSSSATDELAFLFRLSILDFFAQGIYQALLCSLMEWRMSLLAPVSALYTAPYRLAITLRFYFFPKLLGREVPRFTPTGINASFGKAERDARREGRGCGCVGIVLWDCGAWIHGFVLGGCFFGIGVSIVAALGGGCRGGGFCADGHWEDMIGRLVRGLVVRIAWPPVLFLCLVTLKTAWMPIRYAFAPPPFVEREQLLEGSDREEGVMYPKKEVQEQHMGKHSQMFPLVAGASLAGAWLVLEGCLRSSKANY